jgi:acyl-CoA dehydrogenase
VSIIYDEGQQAIATQARRVVEARSDKQRLLGLPEMTGGHDRVFWNTVVEQGWPAMTLPQSHGGMGLGLVELGAVAQAIGAATAGAPFLTTNYGAGYILAAYSHQSLRRNGCPALLPGRQAPPWRSSRVTPSFLSRLKRRSFRAG